MTGLIMASAGAVFAYIGYILLAIGVLLVMITIHEFGHYVAGKIFHFKINEFAIGFGPRLFKKTKKNGEIFSIRAFPLGGFCAFEGEDGNSETDDPNSFNKKKPWQRIIVLIAGAFMNLVLAFLVIVLMLGIYGQQRIVITKISDKIPETHVGYTFDNGDIVEKIDGREIFLATDLINALKGKTTSDVLTVTVRRDGKSVETPIKPFIDCDFSNTDGLLKAYECLGVYQKFDDEGKLASIGATATKVHYGFFRTIGNSFVYDFKVGGTIFQVLGQLLTGKIGLSSLGGPITTVTQTAEMVKAGGFEALLQITAFIGVNLGVFNLLPLPALDGSHVVFTIIEWIRKKPVNRKVEAVIHACGFIFLLGFAVLVDILQLFT